MLYLPPQQAHDGVALDECTTWSVGFRAPAAQELATAFLDFLRDRVALRGRYADPDLRATPTPARIAPAMKRRIERILGRIRWDGESVAEFVGTYLSEPKPTVFFDPPAAPLSRRAFAARIARRGVALDRRTQLLYDERRLYVNGTACRLAASAAALRELADRRALAPARCAALDAATLDRLHDWYRDGFLLPPD
jgi:50S ribosomal protein L16 3-hydroxylase